MVFMRPKLPTLALANLTIAVLLLALAALGLKILNRISTHPELISTSLGTVFPKLSEVSNKSLANPALNENTEVF